MQSRNRASLNFASSGTGTATHLGLELFKAATGINVVHVPYKGGAPALTDLIAGQVQLLFISIPSVMPQVKAGRLKAILSAARGVRCPHRTCRRSQNQVTRDSNT